MAVSLLVGSATFVGRDKAQVYNSKLPCLTGFFCAINLRPQRNFNSRVHARPNLVCRSDINTSGVDTVQIRKCSPLLESENLPDANLSISSEWQVIPDIWKTCAEKFGDQVALIDPHHSPSFVLTYKQLEQEILYFAEGFRAMGVAPNENVALFADNSYRWLISDQGMMTLGVVNVVRGSKSTVEELLQIYNHSQSIALVVDDPTLLNCILEEDFTSKTTIKFIVLMWGDKNILNKKYTKHIPIFTFDEIIKQGKDTLQTIKSHGDEHRRKYKYEAIKPNDVATLIYTSGSTGTPKGVMLTHSNILFEMKLMRNNIPFKPEDRLLSMLPPWHIYERSVGYYAMSSGIELVYTNVRKLKEDLQLYQPHYMMSVPLIYETLYDGIQKKIEQSNVVQKFLVRSFLTISMFYIKWKLISEGKYLDKSSIQNSPFIWSLELLWGKLISATLWPLHMFGDKLIYTKFRSFGLSKGCLSGGGSLPRFVNLFFEAIGIKLINGYGLTETSPVVACNSFSFNIIGSVGHHLPKTELKIVNLETGEVLPPGAKGVVFVRGPHVMKGYYKNSEATNKVLDSEGWFNTGDIGWIFPKSRGRSRQCEGVLVLEGRAKDTIVLSGGENVEPIDLEEAAMQSKLIYQIVVIGQDRRRLGAIVVPNMDEVLLFFKQSNPNASISDLTKKTSVALIDEETRKWTAGCSFQIGPILIVDEPFTIENGLLTPTMKIKRDKVVAKYKEQIDDMYNMH